MISSIFVGCWTWQVARLLAFEDWVGVDAGQLVGARLTAARSVATQDGGRSPHMA
jgi:hypothetical protein